MDQELTPYPLDFDLLEKGSVVPAEQVEVILNVKRSSRDYPLLALQLKNKIIDELERRGLFASVIQDGDDIRVLTDTEAAEYNHRQCQQFLRRAARAVKRQVQVDLNALTPRQRQEHERQLMANAFILSSIRSARRQLVIKQRAKNKALPNKLDPPQQNP